MLSGMVAHLVEEETPPEYGKKAKGQRPKTIAAWKAEVEKMKKAVKEAVAFKFRQKIRNERSTRHKTRVKKLQLPDDVEREYNTFKG
jgi:hypothetical protein